MTDKQKNIIKLTVYLTHILSGITTVAFYTFFLREDFFIEVAQKVVSIFFGSALIAALFYKTQKQFIKIYFRSLSGLTLLYIGLWAVLGFLIMH